MTAWIEMLTMPNMSAGTTSMSWVLAANNPQSLAEFYAEALGCSCRVGLSDQHWMVSLPTGGTLQIYRPSRQRPWPVRGAALAPCFQRIGTDHPETELGCWIEQLEALGRGDAKPLVSNRLERNAGWRILRGRPFSPWCCRKVPWAHRVLS